MTHLQPDILECEVKWALASITMNKTSGSDGIPTELFQIRKDDAVKVLYSICQQIWKTQQWPQDWKGQFSFQPLFEFWELLRILQARLQQYVNCELPNVQAGFRKGRGTRDQIANICWIMEKQESSRKTSISALLTMPKHLTMWITTNWKFWKRQEYQTTWPASWETCMQVRKQQTELDMEQQTGSK